MPPKGAQQPAWILGPNAQQTEYISALKAITVNKVGLIVHVGKPHIKENNGGQFRQTFKFSVETI